MISTAQPSLSVISTIAIFISQEAPKATDDDKTGLRHALETILFAQSFDDLVLALTAAPAFSK